ncbi:hypothetical protein [Butyrivibrio sp. FCS006]|uniref:hypothetical protein n=1 Tax=Butyrivibrio sp. FCS006 TaxID=1280684 RepID=UPI0003FBD177|nr:hypothetical protein [Butyrivibrio sp. FCS006]
MKNNVIRRIVVGIVAATMCLSLAACGNKDVKQEVAETTEEVAEVVEETTETAAEDEMPNPEEELQAIQDSLVFMGGLKTADDAAKKIDVCMFRNEQGDIIYIYNDGDIFDYGMFTTEETKTDDGKTYEKLIGTMGEYGYYFNEDLVSGIIVDSEGNVYDAVELDEAASRELVSKTLGG